MAQVTFRPDLVEAFVVEAFAGWETEASPVAVRFVAQAAPNDTGALFGSHRWETTGATSGKIVADAPTETRAHGFDSYAGIVHEGRGPIVAKPGSVLSFLSRVSGDRVFTRRVGPAAPNRWMLRGATDAGFTNITGV